MGEMKMFIFDMGFANIDGKDVFDNYLPYWLLGVQLLIFFLSVQFKNYLKSQVFKTESHPYY